MSHTTTRLLVPIPDLTDSADVPAVESAIWAVLDPILALISKGTFAARPAAGTVAGKLYYATDTGAFYVTDGTAWQLINPYPASDAVAATASLRTLGTGAQQAASGADSRLSDTRVPTDNTVTSAKLVNGAVVSTKLGLTTVISLQKVGQNGSGLITPAVNLKAGRVLAPADFTTLLSRNTPRVLLAANGTVTDTSGNAVTVTNNGSVAASGVGNKGIDGANGTAFDFDGSTQYLTIPNALKQKTGSWGCWFRTPQRLGTDMQVAGQWQAASTDVSWRMVVDGTLGTLRCEVSIGGGALTSVRSYSTSIVADDVWHFAVMTYDGGKLAVFVDGVLEGAETVSTNVPTYVYPGGGAFQSTALAVGIGAAPNGTSKFEGKISNFFITADVLSEADLRSLYAKKYAHGLSAVPVYTEFNIRKYARSKLFVQADFTAMNSKFQSATAPLTNVQVNSGISDVGSLAKSYTATSTDNTMADPFTGKANSAIYVGAGAGITATDASLPSGATPLYSAGIWFRALPSTNIQILMTWGTATSNAGRALWLDTSGVLWAGNTAQGNTGAVSVGGYADGDWHFVVMVEPASGGSVNKRSLYVDGKLVASTSVASPTLTLGGTLAVGRDLTNVNNLAQGSVAGWFILAAALDGDNVRELYNKVDTSAVYQDRQPMDPSYVIERMDSTNIYFIGDDLEPTDYAELICL